MSPQQTATLPLFVLRREPTSERALGALRSDRRVQLIIASDRKMTWVPAALRAAAVLVLTNSEPLSALLFAVSAGITSPLAIAAPRKYAPLKRDVIGAGAVLLLTTPVSVSGVSELVKSLAAQSPGLQVDETSHLVLDPIARVVRLNAKSVRLSQREFAVLHCLSGKGGRPVSATDVLAYVWGDGTGQPRTREILEVYIFNLRKKLKTLGLTNSIRTVRSYGYALGAGGGDDDDD